MDVISSPTFEIGTGVALLAASPALLFNKRRSTGGGGQPPLPDQTHAGARAEDRSPGPTPTVPKEATSLAAATVTEAVEPARTAAPPAPPRRRAGLTFEAAFDDWLSDALAAQPGVATLRQAQFLIVLGARRAAAGSEPPPPASRLREALV